MIGYKQPVLASTLPSVKQDFDFVSEKELTVGSSKIKPSLDEYDHDGVDGEDADILLGLERWGDRRMRCAG